MHGTDWDSPTPASPEEQRRRAAPTKGPNQSAPCLPICFAFKLLSHEEEEEEEIEQHGAEKEQ